jgi:hypothetical protein
MPPFRIHSPPYAKDEVHSYFRYQSHKPCLSDVTEADATSISFPYDSGKFIIITAQQSCRLRACHLFATNSFCRVPGVFTLSGPLSDPP